MCQACTIDANVSGAFAEKMLGLLNGGAIALMVSVGHRAGLFDAMADGQAVTSQQLAKNAGRNERYCREWLGAMATGEIVEYDIATKQFRLPPEHAAWLTHDATPNNIAVPFQFLPILAQVEDEIVECFEHGGGVPYERYPRFHQIMAEESDQTVVSSLVESILPVADGVISRLESGIDVLDVGCGRGHAMMELAQRFPKSSFAGYDLSPEAIGYARTRAKELGLNNIRFEQRDLSAFAEPERYDFITGFDVIHDQKSPSGLLSGVQRSLRSGGVFLAQDIFGSSEVGHNIGGPVAPFVYTISCLHCMTVSLAQGGEGLGAAWGKELAVSMMRDAGFTDVKVNTLEHDVMNYFYVCRKA